MQVRALSAECLHAIANIAQGRQAIFMSKSVLALSLALADPSVSVRLNVSKCFVRLVGNYEGRQAVVDVQVLLSFGPARPGLAGSIRRRWPHPGASCVRRRKCTRPRGRMLSAGHKKSRMRSRRG